MLELSKHFHFEAAHTLQRTIDADASRRVHGHSYRAVVTIAGEADAKTGMLMDLGHFQAALDCARDALDHRMLDDVEGLGPATIENLSMWIWRALADKVPHLAGVSVHRDSSGDSCVYRGPSVR